MHKEKMMLSESDLYNSNTAPDVKVNPKSLGAMWINYSNGRHYICKDNTNNKNVWLDPIGVLTNEINTNVKNEITKITEKVNNIKSLGINQKWYSTSAVDPNLRIERRIGVLYQNTTSAPIAISIISTGYGNGDVSIHIKPSLKHQDIFTISYAVIDRPFSEKLPSVFGIVPPTFYYIVIIGKYGHIWSELR